MAKFPFQISREEKYFLEENHIPTEIFNFIDMKNDYIFQILKIITLFFSGVWKLYMKYGKCKDKITEAFFLLFSCFRKNFGGIRIRWSIAEVRLSSSLYSLLHLSSKMLLMLFQWQIIYSIHKHSGLVLKNAGIFMQVEVKVVIVIPLKFKA